MKCHQLRLLKRVYDRGQKEGSPFLYLDFLTEKLVAGIIRMRLLAAISRRLPSIPHWPNGSNSSINISVWDYCCIWLLDMNHQTLPSKTCLACIRLNYLLCSLLSWNLSFFQTLIFLQFVHVHSVAVTGLKLGQAPLQWLLWDWVSRRYFAWPCQ